ncbi:MAG TPA: hypothetical protein ENI96_02230 [Sedimenticola thiotaurini]|uniref:Uncharacterized protein n=1 Tax=Sedimenticola thiotaurini TaxID=1543721 RepID=A0A831RLT3_9GAMM|nr:hypothetical protein [Sedimenticola thiotaurini]
MRKRNNPLFPEAERSLDADRLLEAQRLDHEELEAFITGFHHLVHQAINLKPSEESEVILALKERLDKAYEQASGLADEQDETRQALRKLIDVIMAAVRRGAGNDAVALEELRQEEIARAAHFRLLEYPLVADLLDPDSPIRPDELAATLLSAGEEELEAVLGIFDRAQLALLYEDAGRLLARTPEAPESARQRLDQIHRHLEAISAANGG